MKLGSLVQFHISTSDVARSISFYKLMGFQELAYSKKPYKWMVLSDGNLNIIFAEDEFEGLEYYDENMQEKMSEIEGQGIEYENKDMRLGDTWYKVVKDPNDFLIALVEDRPKYFSEASKNDYEPRGRFTEISIHSDKIKESVEFWQKFGYEITHDKREAENPGVSLSDGSMGIGLYSRGYFNHYFQGPAITFRDENMPAVIQNLKDDGLQFQEELKDDDGNLSGAVALSPEGQTFFLFSL